MHRYGFMCAYIVCVHVPKKRIDLSICISTSIFVIIKPVISCKAKEMEVQHLYHSNIVSNLNFFIHLKVIFSLMYV